MRSLFLKIFLWFWLASILIIVSMLVLVSFLEPYRPVPEDGHIVKRMAHQGRRAVEILESGGPGALHDFMQRRGRRRGWQGRNVFLLNENLETVTEQEVSPEARELAVRAGESGVTEFLKLKESFLLARPLYGSGGKTYILVGELPRSPRDSPLLRFLNPRLLGLRLLVIFVIASIFCYWLAWYLASPARTLRAATRQLAAGNFKTRVGSQLGRRKDELADLGHDFDVMAERIESLMTSQGRLLRDISHELRSPLARLNVALELARQRSGNEAVDSLDRIGRESDRLNILIGQLRTLTLLESGAESVDKKILDLSVMVKAIADDADYEAGSRNRSVRAELDENIKIEGSEELLGRAIENVVRNAVRYTDEKTEVEITLRSRHANGNETAVIVVRDHGPGVPEDELARLFSPFYRVAESRDRESGGMGIGLAITDRAVRLHKGQVMAENSPDGGLTIKIMLPVYGEARGERQEGKNYDTLFFPMALLYFCTSAL